MNELKQLKAAAGSGKTYALTARFLELMQKGKEEANSMACSATAPQGYSWPEILAATFTNKAAAEMKERVVASIKRTALEIPQGQRANWSPKKAEKTLDNILRRYNQLGIRTIDSLLNLLLRVFALDAGLRPDFELIFDTSEPFDAALDTLIAACAAGDARLADLYTDSLRTMLHFETDSSGKSVFGFRLESRLRKKLLELTEYLLQHPGPVETDKQKISSLLVPAFDAFSAATSTMQQCIKNGGLKANQNFLKFLAKCQELEFLTAPPTSTFSSKETLVQCVNKPSRPLVSPAAETCYHDFKSCYNTYAERRAVLSRAYALAPAVELAREILDRMNEQERLSGYVLGSTLPGRVRALLDSDFGVPDAFCRLGSRLHHLLIDEFQDTSRDQWAAISPLAEECLSKGGSLFYVGDVKQAIYGWRGGDATLFDAIGSDQGLANMVEQAHQDTLPCNWRSRQEIVHFNNDFFTRLAQPDTTDQLAKTLLKGAPESCQQDFARSLSRTFADAGQKLPKDKDDKETAGGYVCVRQLAGDNASEIEQQGLDAATALVVDDLAHRWNLSDICMLVRKKDHATMLCDQLVARGIPVVTESSLRLNLHPIPRQLAALLTVVDFPGDDMALAQLLLGDLFLHRSGLSHAELVQWLASRPSGPLHLAFREHWPEIWNRCLAPFVRKAGLMTPYDLASDAADYFQVMQLYPDAELFLRRFLELVHSAAESGRNSLASFLEMWTEKGDEEKVSLPDSVNAVRIMTMHKAKGLQFPVVVIPFLFWKMPNDNPLMTVEMDQTPIITSLAKAMTIPYFKHRQKNSEEQLNLLYVAFTRAEEELYVYTPRTVRGTAPAHAAMDLLLPLDAEQPLLERGTPGHGKDLQAVPKLAKPDTFPPTPATDKKTDKKDEPELMAWLPRLRVHRHMEEATFDVRMRGEAAHRAMEYLRPPAASSNEEKNAAILRARTLAMQDFPLLEGLPQEEYTQFKEELDGMLDWVINHDQLAGWLAKGRSEASFLDANGDSKRPDFLHLGDRETVILEFKTGAQQPEHARQTRAYMDMAAQVFPGKPVRGVVVYLDQQLLVEVSKAS